MIGQILGYLTSIFGIFTVLLGMVVYFILPVFAKLTPRLRVISRFYLWQMAQTLGRGAFSVSAHNDILLKQMSFDDRGVEMMSYGDQDKAFEDPDDARHYWYNIPFALADEVHGVLFDPRHAAVGKQKRTHERADEMIAKATASEKQTYGVKGWVRGVFGIDRDTFDVLDLSAARQLVTGIERSEHPEAVDQFVQLSREPYKSGASTTRILIILAALIGPFAAMAAIAKYIAPPTSSVGFGAVVYAILGTHGVGVERLKTHLPAVLGVVLTVAVLAVASVLLGPGLVVAILVSLALGVFATMVIVLALGKGMSEKVARLLLKLGLLGYNQPVLTWTQSKYELREYDTLETDEEPYWYGVAGSLLGFTFEPTPESFASVHVPNDDITDRAEVLPDGGASTNIPARHARFPEQRRADYAGFVPKRVDDSQFYVNTGTVFEAFTHAAVGIKSHRFLTRAKEKYGGESSIADKVYVYAVAGTGLVSLIAGVMVFFVL